MVLIERGYHGYYKKGYKSPRRGKTYDEIYGVEKSKEIREKMSNVHMGRTAWNKGIKHEAIRGKNHWNWRGGITPPNKQRRKSLEWKEWRKLVFLRDNYSCQKCYKYNCVLEPHHTKSVAAFPELIYDVENGMTLCYDCHKQTRMKNVN